MGLPVTPNPVALYRCFGEDTQIRSLFTVVSHDPEHTSMQSCSGSGSRHEFVSPIFRPPLRGNIPFMVAEPRLAIVIGVVQHNRWQPWATHMAKNTKIHDALPRQQHNNPWATPRAESHHNSERNLTNNNNNKHKQTTIQTTSRKPSAIPGPKPLNY